MATDVLTRDFDVLIVGGGLAALRAAIAASATPGTRVAIAVKRKLGRSGASANTTGAYAICFYERDVETAAADGTSDSPAIHFRDTLEGGNGVNDPVLARLNCEEGPARVQELIDWGVPFIRDNGHLHRSPSGDHSFPRVLAPVNHSGLDETLVLARIAEEQGVVALENTMVVDLLRSERRVIGAVAVHRTDGDLVVIRAKAVVLATGGCGRLFSRTSNPADVTGDGYLLALRAGARVRDMEFIQFYPWRCISPFKSGRMPIQPSTFALGGKLFNSDGERFMERYDPVRKDATFRAVAARGIYDQIRFHKTVEGGVLLDISEVPYETFKKDNPRMIRILDKRGQDPYEMRMIIAPEAHFFMGGVCIDANGMTGVPGLFAAGEVAGGIHGGNRLDSTAVPDTQVFGKRAGEAAAAYVRDVALADIPAEDVDRWSGRCGGGTDDTRTTLAAMREDLRQQMWFHLGIVRERESLETGLAYVDENLKALRTLDVRGARALAAAMELEAMLETARLGLTAALTRTESRGAHYRDDFPEQDDANWLKTVVLRLEESGELVVSKSGCDAALAA